MLAAMLSGEQPAGWSPSHNERFSSRLLLLVVHDNAKKLPGIVLVHEIQVVPDPLLVILESPLEVQHAILVDRRLLAGVQLAADDAFQEAVAEAPEPRRRAA
jgi:hypothetical protein